MRPGNLVCLSSALIFTLPAFAAPPAGAAARPAVPTIQIYSRETIVDVIVTDARGNPVRGLQQSDFTIKEDGKPQPIRSFGEFSVDTRSPIPTAPLLPAEIRTNYQASPTSGPVNILLIDALHLNWVSAVRSLQAVAAYADHMPRGTQVAVFWLSASGLHMLQGFTTDPELIRQAVSATRTDIGSNQDCYAVNKLTIEALNQIAAYVAGIKGRKNLLWFTPGMPIYLLRDGGYGWGTTSACHESTPERVFANPDARAAFGNTDPNSPRLFGADNIDTYTLFTSAAGATDEGLDMSMVHHLMDTYEVFTNEQIAVSPVNAGGVGRMDSGNLVAEEVAEQSGGQAKYNSNDLVGEVYEAISAGSHYYTISYVPPRKKDDGHYHTIAVNVDRENLRIIARKGYNAEDPRLPKPFAGPDLIKAALQGRAPSATQLLFDASLAPVGTADASGFAEPVAAPAAPSKSKGKSQAARTAYDLFLAIPQSQIAFRDANDGTYTLNLQFAFDAYDLNGRFLGSHRQNVALHLTPDRYADFIQKPVIFHEQISLLPGPLFIRVGVLDNTSNKVGTLEIPLTIPKK